LNISDFFIVLPAFNEGNSLPGLILNLKRIFSRSQIILADDGSRDNSSRVARKYGIRIIRNRTNRGKGHILRNVFAIILQKFPTFKWVITLDADGQHHHGDITRFIQTIDQYPDAEIIIGRRDFNQMPSLNQISNKLTSFWSNYWLDWNLHDLQCGFRCYSAKALRHILNFGLTRNKFDLETEILLVAWLLDLEIVEIPVRTIYSRNIRKSRVQPVIDTTRWMFLIMQYGFSPHFISKVWQKQYIKKILKEKC
jgi:glycosyltransferase involved in cell wall biosynthesis